MLESAGAHQGKRRYKVGEREDFSRTVHTSVCSYRHSYPPKKYTHKCCCMHAVIYGHTQTQYMCTNDLQTTTTHDISTSGHIIPSRQTHLAVILHNQLYKVATIFHSHFYKGTEVKSDHILTQGLTVIHHSQLYEGTEIKHATPPRADTLTQREVVERLTSDSPQSDLMEGHSGFMIPSRRVCKYTYKHRSPWESCSVWESWPEQAKPSNLSALRCSES